MAMTASDILMSADLFRRAYPNWTHAEPEEAPVTPVTSAPVYRKGDRVTHLGVAATVAHGNVPDEWGSPDVVSIRYDRAPRGHSAQKDVPASECTPLAPACWADPLSRRERIIVAGLLARASKRFHDAAWTAPDGRRATCRQVVHAQACASIEMQDLHLDVTERAEAATS